MSTEEAASSSAGSSGSSSSDPYATSKANLRDTIKWLAGIFAGLAAVVIAGAPISGIGSPSLSPGCAALGVVAILVSFACICTAVVKIMQLLRPDLMYPSDLDTRIEAKDRPDADEVQAIRDEISTHQKDLFPDYASYAVFLTERDRATEAAEQYRQAWAEKVDDLRVAPEQVQSAKCLYDVQIEQVRAFESVESGILAFSSFFRFYRRLRKATPSLIGLGTGALIALLIFSFAVQVPKQDHVPQVVVVPIVSPALPASASSKPELKSGALVGTMHFATGSAAISIEERPKLEKVRAALTAHPDSALLVIARTDTMGGRSVNTSLARDRANSVRTMLVGAGGIAAARVFAAELPKGDLPKITGDQEANDDNRSVSMYLVPFRR